MNMCRKFTVEKTSKLFHHDESLQKKFLQQILKKNHFQKTFQKLAIKKFQFQSMQLKRVTYIFSKKNTTPARTLSSCSLPRHFQINIRIPKPLAVSKYSSPPYFKITNHQENHHDFQYKDGLNILQEKFNPMPYCAGGFHFTNRNSICQFLNLGTNLRRVLIPSGTPDLHIANVSTSCVEQWKANKIILGKKYSLATVVPYQKFNLCDETFLHWNIERGHCEVIDYLLRKNDYLRDPALFRLAIENGQQYAAKVLVNHGFDFHANQEYALRYAAFFGHGDLVEFLVKRGANVHAMDDFAFKWSIRNGHLNVARFLANNRAFIH